MRVVICADPTACIHESLQGTCDANGFAREELNILRQMAIFNPASHDDMVTSSRKGDFEASAFTVILIPATVSALVWPEVHGFSAG